MRWRRRTRTWSWSRAAALTFVAMSQTPSRTPRRSRSCERREKAGSIAVDGNRYFARPAQSLAAGAALWSRGARTGRWSSPRTICPKRAWAGVASTSPARRGGAGRARRGVRRPCGGAAAAATVAVVRAATRGSRRRRGARRRRLGGGARRSRRRRQGDVRRPGDGLLGLHVARAPGARQVLRQRLPPLLLRPR